MVTHRSPFSTTVLIAGIDTIRQKNLYQLQGLGDYGYRFIVIAVDPDGDSRDIVDGLENVEIFTLLFQYDGESNKRLPSISTLFPQVFLLVVAPRE